jgi:hypothetical protein
MINFPDTAAIGEIFTPPGTGSPSFVYRGSDVWQNVGMGFGYQPQLFTATAGQTVFTVAYQVGAVEVFMEGAQLHPTEFTATNGTSITLVDPCLGGEKLVVTPLSVLSTLQGLQKSLNLSDLPDVDTALTNLGFGAFGKTLRAAADAAAARASLGQWGTVISDQTLVAVATQFADVPLAGYSEFRFTMRAAPNPAAADFNVQGAFSYDGGSTFPAGASEYTRLTLSGNSGGVVAGISNSTAMQICWGIDTATASIIGRADGLIWKGSATERPRLKSHASYYDGSVFSLATIENMRATAGLATHLRVFASVANGLGIGSNLTVEGRV